ncbi:protein WVD2-like 4 [Pyrus x bretschneideri]|uniref:protein WVD2-like 4 n=1 Tax=Pyrus x bretschneideri TaxID=225117 RepID=UPI00202FC9CC|nr:protein WVD2-like 4 [Pyrus x bretschneideri]XP_048432639.1 protein WVD2-like 4 [Pyrus x bretschneideri]
MESENGVTFEDESCVIEEKHVDVSVPDLSKKGKNADGNIEVPAVKGISEPVTKDEGINSSEVAVAAIPPGKNSKTTKNPHAPNNGLSKSKPAKDKPIVKGATPFLHKERATLSQSLSFPARGSRTDPMKKSIDVYPVKTEVKHARGNATKAEAPISVSRLNNPTRRASTGVHSKDGNSTGGASIKRTSLASIPSIRSSPPGKSGSVDTSANSPSDVIRSVDQSLNAVKTTLPIKEDDDAHSVASTTPSGRRISASGFSFRLEERAEKRKEFFTKLEEKTQAKEEEKNNSQAKSKESQEAEIKRLRKSLTFKAAPMPSFYKEPPPKVELKKIPTTRPKSPKLGRNKSSISSLNNSSEVAGVSLSPRLNRELNNSKKGLKTKSEKDVIDPKKPVKKSQTRLHSQETAATKTEAKCTEEETHDQKACTGKTEEAQDQSGHLSKFKDEIEPEASDRQIKEPVLGAPIPEIMPHEVSVGV